MTRAQRSGQLHQMVGERLGAVGQRYTPSRRALVEALFGAGRPLPIADVVAAAGLPQSSVYRNLSVLEAAGTVRRVSGADEFARFELDEPFLEHHHHLVCLACGLVSDLAAEAGEEAGIERVVDAAAATGFHVTGHRLDLMGRCSSCAGSIAGAAR
jgi:Fe2+ or Zn2+ uptake regulation protein